MPTPSITPAGFHCPPGALELNASGAGGVRVRNGASIDVAAAREVFGGKTVAVPGGRIALRATQGDIAIDRGASLDVSASGGGLAGVISTQAAAGTVGVDPRAQLQARGAQGSGAWLFDAEAFAADTSLSVLNTQLNGNGFGGTRVFRVRHGDFNYRAWRRHRSPRRDAQRRPGAIPICRSHRRQQ